MDMYLPLSFASGVVITTLAFISLLVRIEPDEESRKIRFARAILAASYFLLAVPDWLNVFGLNDSDDIAAATIVSASIQSLLFTFTLITMIQPSLVTTRRTLVNIALVAVGSVCYLVADSLAGSPIVTCVAVAAVIVQLLLYTALFQRCYKKFVRQVKDYYDEEYERPLHWARNSFAAALAVGVLAMLSLTVPQPVYNAFMCCYIAFYIWFASRFINYIIRSDYYLPAVKVSAEEIVEPEPEPKTEPEMVASDLDFNDSSEQKKILQVALEEYVASKDYLNPDRDRNYIIERSGIDPRYFRWYFQNVLTQDFRVWRANLRIEEAKRIILTTPDVSMNALAIKLGFGTSQNFYHHFKKVVGQTPTEFLEACRTKSSE